MALSLVLLIHPEPIGPREIWGAWSWEPAVIGGMVLSLALFASGTRAIWRRAGWGRGVSVRQVVWFGVGWIMLALALLSPLHALAESLFSAHMAQHLVLMVVAAPLLVLGRPLVPMLWALRPGTRRAVGRWARQGAPRRLWSWVSLPAVAWAIHAVAIWVWHIPGLYQRTLDSELIHAAQHTCFLGSALLFWWAVLRRHAGRSGTPGAAIYLFTTGMHSGLLGALLTFSSRLWYPIYLARTAPWGLTPLEDQQLAGLIMWIPAGLVYLAATLWVMAGWMVEPGARAPVSAPQH